MAGAYYNEHDPAAAAWLRELIARQHIGAGDVDERSIVDVMPDDLREYTQCHFFAGIGGWSHALRLAGWPDDRPVWTGSCPCQPFSSAGKQKGLTDERHLWPEFFRLIQERRPVAIFGEQVASKDGLGWLDIVLTDLEGADYAAGAVDLCAPGVGAPHIRQRLWLVARNMADAESAGHAALTKQRGEQPSIRAPEALAAYRGAGGMGDADHRNASSLGSVSPRAGAPLRSRGAGGMADAHGGDSRPERQQRGGEHGFEPQDRGADFRMADAPGERHDRRRAGEARDEPGAVQRSERLRDVGGLADAEHDGHDSDPISGGTGASEVEGRLFEPEGRGAVGLLGDAFGEGSEGLAGPDADPSGRVQPGRSTAAPGSLILPGNFWKCEWLPCSDGKARPIEPGTFPLAHGVSGRVVRLRGYGNAIVPQVAAEVIRAAHDLFA